MSTAIVNVHARQIIDSRGNPTVEADVILDGGAMGRAAVPSGASTGEHEAIELRDGDKSRYLGKGVTTAVANANGAIAAAVRGMNATDQRATRSPNGRTRWHSEQRQARRKRNSRGINGRSARRSRRRKNSALSLSREIFWRAGAAAGVTLPVPMMNILNGGAHADNSVDPQEFMVMPVGAPSFSEALRMGVEIFHNLKAVLHKRGYSTAVGDEGGFAPNLKSNEEALEVVLEAITKAGYKPGEQAAIALDPAASEFYDKASGKYIFKKSDKSSRDSAQMADFWANWARQYPIVSIEDGMAEDDWSGWALLTQKLGATTQLVGDDLFVTNTTRLSRGIAEKIANAILIKLNQIGTVTETIEAIEMARKAGYASIVSHRSGETEDTFISDFVVAMGTGQIKTGSASRTDRIAKYNQLLRIEEELGKEAKFAGRAAVKNCKL